MLEIPESYTISEQLNQTIIGKTILNVEADTFPHKFAFYFNNPSLYQDLLVGKKISDVIPIAGQIEITAGNIKIVFADGVNVRYFNDNKKLPKKYQLYIEFDDYSCIVCTVQMYGGLWVFRDGENINPYYTVSKEKPSPLTDTFDSYYFKDLINESKQTVSVKAFLATEQRIPGLGNGVLQDILFNAKINPKSKIGELSENEKENLYKSTKQTLFEMTAQCGRNTEKDLFGCIGGYRSILSNKTFKNPCPICGNNIIKQAYMGGSIYYCPICQPF